MWLQLLTRFGAPCPGGGLLGFPTWYKYIQGNPISTTVNGKAVSSCAPVLNSINDIWLIGAAIVDMLLRIAALGAIGIVIWGGIKMITSQGDPSGVASARNTIMDGLIGLTIALVATGAITFVAGRF